MSDLINYNRFNNAVEKVFDSLFSPNFLKDFNDDIFNDKSWVVKDNQYEMKFENIPDKLDNLNVSVEDNSIKIEYGYKDDNSSQTFSAYRSLPEDCDFEKISADVENNVLTIIIPRNS